MDDLISRQAAIDAVQRHREGVLGGYEYDEGVAFVYAAAHNHIIQVIKLLPSAQTEIIRCKDCVFKQGKECTRFADLPIADDDFCSRGEGKEKRNESDRKDRKA